MGIDTALAIDKLEDEFVCSICHDILHDPIVISRCEHYFCNNCIRPWIQANSTCPKDRDPVEEAGLRQPVRFFRNKLADVRLRCQFSSCNREITYEGFERHKTNCPHNPDAWMECTFCHFKHMIKQESIHKKTCIPFLHDTIDKKESEKKKVERKREADKKQYDDKIERMEKKSRTVLYILTWDAKFPTRENHQQNGIDFYYTWNSDVGNLVDGTRKINPRFKLDHGKMGVGLRLDKETDERSINIQFFLTTGKKARVKFNWSLSSAGKVLWQKERTEELKVRSNRTNGCTGGHIHDLLPSDMPSNLLAVVEVTEWEPNIK